MDDVWKLLTILLAGFAAYIAFQQFRLGREKFKLDLFEKRFAVFDATRKFLSTILTEGHVDMQIVYEYRAGVAEASFLFDSDITEYLDEIDNKAIDLRALQDRMKGLADDGKRNEYIDKELAAITWLSDRLVHLKVKFSPYLKFHVWQ